MIPTKKNYLAFLFMLSCLFLRANTEDSIISSEYNITGEKPTMMPCTNCNVSNVTAPILDGSFDNTYPNGYWKASYFNGYFSIPGSTFGSENRDKNNSVGTPEFQGEAYFGLNNLNFNDTRTFVSNQSPTAIAVAPSTYIGANNNGGVSFYQIQFNRKADKNGNLNINTGTITDDILEIYINGVQHSFYGSCCGSIPYSSLPVSIPFNEGDDISLRMTNLGGNGRYNFDISLEYDCSCTATVITNTPRICAGKNAEFEITSEPGNIVDYTFDGLPEMVTVGPTGTQQLSLNVPNPGSFELELISITDSNGNTTNLANPRPKETILVEELPVITVGTPNCSMSLLTYDVAFTLSKGTITSTTSGTVSGNSVINIPSGTNITVTATSNGCTSTATVIAPNCVCPTVKEPINPQNKTVCEGATNTELSVLLPSAPTLADNIHWYNSATGGTQIGDGLTFTPNNVRPGVYTYYAEAIQLVSGCSSNRIPVSLTIDEAPVLRLVATDCAIDLMTYSVDLSLNVGAITATTYGTISGNRIINIPANTDISVTAINGSCTTSFLVEAPDCTCPFTDKPINPKDVTICEGDSNPSLQVTLPSFPALGDEVRWFDAASAGNHVGSGLTFTPTNTLPGSYFYYAEALQTVSGCHSDRIAVIFTIVANPEIVNKMTNCALDLVTYSVDITLNIGTITNTTAGTISGNQITNIPAGTPITITASNGSCVSSFNVDPPDCSCSFIAAPINPQNGNICEGDIIPDLEVSFPLPPALGNQIYWYDAESAGNLVGTGIKFTPTITAVGSHTYYAEAVDLVTGCSSNRVAVTFNITAISKIDILNSLEACEVFELPILSDNNFYYTGLNATGNQIEPLTIITKSQQIYIVAAPGTQCQQESSFTVTILNEPIATLPESTFICPANPSLVLGEDLGPNVRYDWTPDNDIDSDGKEEALFNISEPGKYTLQIYQIGSTMECGGMQIYTTEVLEQVEIMSVDTRLSFTNQIVNSGNKVTVTVNNDSSISNLFLYSIDDVNGPYQNSNVFENVIAGLHNVYVMPIDKSGLCFSTTGSDSFLVVNYPNVFTPNGDGINDTWNVLGLNNASVKDVSINIFNRFGKLLTQLTPDSKGWDGTFNGVNLPATDYWFTVDYGVIDPLSQSVEFNGHFSLIR